MHVSIQGHLNIGGHSPRRDWIIASTTLTIDKTRIFPMAQTWKPTIQETQRRLTLAREQCSPLHGLAKASRLLQYQAQPKTPLLRVQYSHSQSSWVSPSTERLRRLPHIIQKLGRMNFAKQASQKNTHISSQGSVMAFTSVFLSLTIHNLLLIKIPWLSSQVNSTELYKWNTERMLSWSNLKTKHGDPYQPILILTLFYHSETGTSQQIP